MPHADPEIAVLLPYAEGFGPAAAGAIALTVRDVTEASRFKDRTRVYGRAVDPVFQGLAFQPLQPALRRLLPRNLGLAEAFRRMQTNRPVLAEVHNRPNMFHYLRRLAPRLPLAIRFGNDPLSMKRGGSWRSRAVILKRAEVVYCVSDFVRRRFLDGLDDREGKAVVVHHAIARPRERPLAKEPLVLYVGRVVPGKGVDHLVEALLEILPAHPDWRALIIGASRPGATRPSPFEEALRASAAPLAPRIEFLDFLPNAEVMDYYRRAAVSVVPSTVNEALSRTAIEGIAHGCAVIGYASGGIPEALHGRGLVLEDKTPRALADALAALISDDQRRAALQERAWTDYPFTTERMAAAYDGPRAQILERIAGLHR